MADRGPTPSPETNRLLALCAAARDRKAVVDGLAAALEERTGALAALRERMAEQRKTLPPSPQLQAQADRIDAVVDRYAAALEEIAAFLQDGRLGRLEAAEPALKAAAMGLALGLQEFELLAVAMGPTTSPYYNLLFRAWGAFLEGRLALADFRTMIEDADRFMSKAQDELDAVRETDAPEPVDRLRAAYAVHKTAMAEILRFFDDADPVHLAAGFAQLAPAVAAMQYGYRDFTEQKLEQYPTKSAAVNTVLLAARGVKAGTLEPLALDLFLTALDDYLGEAWKEFQAVFLYETDSVVLQEEIPKATDAFTTLGAGIESMRGYLASKDPAMLDQGTDQLAAGVAQLYASYEVFIQVEERGSSKLCFRCLHVNTLEARVCARCGATLPRLEEETLTSTMTVNEDRTVELPGGLQITENIQRLLDAADDVVEGRTTPSEFAGILTWFQGVLLSGQAELDAVSARQTRLTEENDQVIVGQLVAVLQGGLADLRQGLDILWKFLDKGNKTHLVEGMKIILQAAGRMREVEQFAEEMNAADNE